MTSAASSTAMSLISSIMCRPIQTSLCKKGQKKTVTSFDMTALYSNDSAIIFTLILPFSPYLVYFFNNFPQLSLLFPLYLVPIDNNVMSFRDNPHNSDRTRLLPWNYKSLSPHYNYERLCPITFRS